jgi:alkylation response protein AidB-like acyl-CoA dehydrogenase
MDTAATLALFLDRVIDRADGRPDHETTSATLDEAARFAERHLAPLAAVSDTQGCRMVAGRVKTADGPREAWRAFAEAGWLGLTAPEEADGQGLPFALGVAVQEMFDAAYPAFGMLPIDARCATRLLERNGDAGIRGAWRPNLASGAWGAAICISEPQAGSDVGPIRTHAVEDGDGTWRITGEKCWISSGDHDLAERIGHFAIARPQGAPAGTRGLSFYVVPDTRDDGSRNGAAAMRLSVAAQGAAVAQAAAGIAERYARQRGQGGSSDAPPTPIDAHAEVRRLRLQMRVRAEAARLIALQTAAWVDAGDAGDASASARAEMMLPMAKTFCAEVAVANADAAIQVLGGAGYVNEWPVERMLRDARVFTIYEGATAIQGIDLLQRRVLGQFGDGVLAALVDNLAPQPELAAQLPSLVASLARAPARAVEAAAVPFLRLLALVASDGLLRQAAARAGPLGGRYAALADFHALEARREAALLIDRCRHDDFDAAFDAVFAA